MLFHLFAHVDLGADGKPSIDEVEVRAELVEWIQEHKNVANVHAEDWLKRKGLTFDEWLEFIAVPGNKGDSLALYFLARYYDKHTAIIGKSKVFFTHDGPPDSDVEECPMVFVYLGRSVFRNTRLRVGGRPPVLSQPPAKRVPPSADAQDEDWLPVSTSTVAATLRRSSRHNKPSAAAGAPPAPAPAPAASPAAPSAKKPRGRPGKPKPKTFTVPAKIHGVRKAKKRVFHKKCGLCGQIFDSQKLLNDHTKADHNNYR